MAASNVKDEPDKSSDEPKISLMDPHAKPNERKVGAQRPNISHLPANIGNRTWKQRQAEKQAVTVERRAIKKSVRQRLKQQLLDELEENN
jgi:hypothetical protein